VIKVRVSGLCYTDINVLHPRYGAGAFPVVPDHEYAGEVLSLGDGVTGFHIGQRVVVDPNLSCRSCLHGRFNLSSTLGAYGVSTNGGFA
jgi:D-arabinose 1-dehydrogenase-like Zn-dependent alcohol dehydrogenase